MLGVCWRWDVIGRYWCCLVGVVAWASGVGRGCPAGSGWSGRSGEPSVVGVVRGGREDRSRGTGAGEVA